MPTHRRAALLLALAASPALAAAGAGDDPLLRPWKGPYGGVPPFDEARVERLLPALEAGIADEAAAVERVAQDPAPATFENTLVPLERAGRPLERALTVYRVLTAGLSTPALREVEKAAGPRLAAREDRIYQDSRLLARLDAVSAGADRAGLGDEERRLVWVYRNRFERAGARLDAAAKARLAEINQELARRFTAFRQNVLADETGRFVVLEKEEDLAGLPPEQRAALAAAATAKGQPGRWLVANTRSSVEPFLSASTRRDLREQVWRAFTSRGDLGTAGLPAGSGDDHDNKALAAEILRLRAERARLLGYPTHAHWRLADQMAGTPERALGLLEAVWAPAVARVRQEVAELQAVADREGAGVRIAPWDYRFYAEKVRRERYQVDEEEVKPYLQLEKLREGMFQVASRLFGLRFVPLPAGKVPVAHPDVRVWEVRGRDGRHAGLWYFDPYARDGKRSGAWMSEYRSQQRLDGPITPIVSNNSNFVKPAPGAPVLVSWEDARTLFHEFGHAVHGLCSSVRYPSLAGTEVATDFVEFPSQLLEHWLSTPEILDRWARHHRTGKPMPRALVERIRRAEGFGQGFRTGEYLASALVDLKLHLAGDRPVDVAAFEKETLAALGTPPELVMRHRIPHFAHVFAGDGYAAGYYSYLWSDTLTADAWEAFTEARGGPWDRAVARRLQQKLLAVGNTVDPAAAYRAFRGRDPGIGPLMKKRGFPWPPPAAPAGGAGGPSR